MSRADRFAEATVIAVEVHEGLEKLSAFLCYEETHSSLGSILWAQRHFRDLTEDFVRFRVWLDRYSGR